MNIFRADYNLGMSMVTVQSEGRSSSSEEDNNNGELRDQAKLYVDMWSVRMIGGDLVVEGCLLEHPYFVLNNAPFLTRRVVKVVSPRLVQDTTGQLYVLEGRFWPAESAFPTGLFPLLQPLWLTPQFVLDTFAGGFPGNWQEVRRAWVDFVARQEGRGEEYNRSHEDVGGEEFNRSGAVPTVPTAPTALLSGGKQGELTVALTPAKVGSHAAPGSKKRKILNQQRLEEETRPEIRRLEVITEGADDEMGQEKQSNTCQEPAKENIKKQAVNRTIIMDLAPRAAKKAVQNKIDDAMAVAASRVVGIRRSLRSKAGGKGQEVMCPKGILKKRAKVVKDSRIAQMGKKRGASSMNVDKEVAKDILGVGQEQEGKRQPRSCAMVARERWKSTMEEED